MGAGTSFLLQLVAATVLSAFLGPEDVMAFGPAVAAAVSIGIAWVTPAFSVVYLFEQRPFKHFAVNAGYHVVSFIVMGLIIAARLRRSSHSSSSSGGCAQARSVFVRR